MNSMSRGLFIGGTWVEGATQVPVINKYTRHVIGETSQADPHHVRQAVDAADSVRSRTAGGIDRAEILNRVALLLADRRDDLVGTIVAEGGFTVREAEVEVTRSLETLRLTAHEAKKCRGEVIPFSGAVRSGDRFGFTIRVPVGVVCAITPFNAPLNTVCHKVAPAFAAGNAVILKPSPHTPLTAAILCDAFAMAGAPPGSINMLTGNASDIVRQLLDDERVNFFSFTGSTQVGIHILKTAGLRRTQLELGSISATVICEDADIESALNKCVPASFRKAGQICTSIQLLMVDRRVFKRARDLLVEKTKLLVAGDPNDRRTDVGPVISEQAAERISSWIEEAVSAGAKCLTERDRSGSVLAPIVLENVTDQMSVMSKEVFGPVVCLIPVESLQHAIYLINKSPYGLAVGVFTGNLSSAFLAAQEICAGAVYINETSNARVDLMPYGGVKQSGFGKEGPEFSIKEMTEERVVSFTI
jgi:acyl-CoA reductase-like NAD-dependent aldehyde dehydrogenase